MDRNIVVRCNAGEKYGLGHLSRCLSLINVFQSDIIEFVIKTDTRFLVDSFLNEYKQCKNLKVYYHDCNLTEELDLIEVKCLVRKSNSILILDHYEITEKYQVELLEANIKWLQFDSHAKDHLYGTWVLHGSPGAKKELYLPLVKNKESVLLLGVEFAIIKPEVLLLRQLCTVRESINTIVVSFGGGYDSGATLRILEYLKKYMINSVIKYTISKVIKEKDIISNCLKGFDNFIQIESKELSNEMATCDLAIISPGMTSYEAACLGVPMILISTASNQLINANGWADKGCALNLGSIENLSFDIFATKLSGIIENNNILKDMSLKGMSLVDGLGSSRVRTIINNL